MTKGDPLKNDHKLETGAAAHYGWGLLFFSLRSYVLFKENDENPMVLGPLGENLIHPGFVICFDPSTRQIVNSSLLAGAARKSLLLFKPLCPKTRSVPEESWSIVIWLVVK